MNRVCDVKNDIEAGDSRTLNAMVRAVDVERSRREVADMSAQDRLEALQRAMRAMGDCLNCGLPASKEGTGCVGWIVRKEYRALYFIFVSVGSFLLEVFHALRGRGLPFGAFGRGKRSEPVGRLVHG